MTALLFDLFMEMSYNECDFVMRARDDDGMLLLGSYVVVFQASSNMKNAILIQMRIQETYAAIYGKRFTGQQTLYLSCKGLLLYKSLYLPFASRE